MSSTRFGHFEVVCSWLLNRALERRTSGADRQRRRATMVDGNIAIEVDAGRSQRRPYEDGQSYTPSDLG